ncbi:hypothetical protein MVEN_02547400 [Mycena venus]|uniref:Uncharacterized protein n=1 Tax=Mycena venus TaxID=2733690 RepID=A0A8H6U2D7_9AGAR|nr:hypothetical protein MVEN_02547400 [Mycena venus]
MDARARLTASFGPSLPLLVLLFPQRIDPNGPKSHSIAGDRTRGIMPPSGATISKPGMAIQHTKQCLFLHSIRFYGFYLAVAVAGYGKTPFCGPSYFRIFIGKWMTIAVEDWVQTHSDGFPPFPLRNDDSGDGTAVSCHHIEGRGGGKSCLTCGRRNIENALTKFSILASLIHIALTIVSSLF